MINLVQAGYSFLLFAWKEMFRCWKAFISLETDLELWLGSIFNKFTEHSVQIPFLPPIDQLRNVLRLVIFAIHISRKDQIAPITTTSWVKYISDAIDSVCTSHNIMFYSKEQFPVLITDDPKHKKVIIKGGFGTSKTFLLQQKAILLSKQQCFKGAVMYVCATTEITEVKDLLYWRTLYDLKSHGILVTEEEFSRYATDNVCILHFIS